MLHRPITGSATAAVALLAIALAGCGQASPAPGSTVARAGEVAARVSPAARDKMAQMLIKEYKGLSWYSDADKKQAVLEALVATGSDLAVDLLIKEYEGLSWYSDKARKLAFLDLLKQLAATPTGGTTEAVFDGETLKAAPAAGPTRKALYRAAESLKKDLPTAPREAQAKIQDIISKVLIIAPNTGR